MGQSLYEKVFERHLVRRLPSGQYQLFVGLHLLHEVTSPQAFAMLRERGLEVMFPERTFATVDHVVPTTGRGRPYADAEAEQMVASLEQNTRDFGIRLFSPEADEHGIVHVLGPERGLSQPGMTICCGDSHTATHGALGAVAFGIGTSQVRDVLATQTLAVDRLKVRRIEVNGRLGPGVFAKDVILHVIRVLGVKGGVGYAHEYAGEVIEGFGVEERMTVCNMSIEAGARVGYVNPDSATYRYLEGREYAPRGAAWERAVEYWESSRSDPDAQYDDLVRLRAEDISPLVTWGITPAQSVAIDGQIPRLEQCPEEERAALEEACRYMGFVPGQPIAGTRIDVAFIGSCTNGRLSDFEAVVRCLERGSFRVHPRVKALVVPGSQQVKRELVARGWDRVLEEAGFSVRDSGCSLCLAMNPDRLVDRELCASSSNRNFKGRQGSPTGRTLLMSPVMVAAAAIAGEVVDARQLFGLV